MAEPKVRFKRADGSSYPDIQQVPFGDVVKPFTEKTTTENEDVLLSCAINGVFLNTELFGHQRGASNKGYKKIRRNTLILSAQNLHLGNANVNQRFDHGIISPAYNTYDIVGCNPDYMAQWVKRDATKKYFYDATTVGASQCRRNVDWNALYEQPFYVPCEEEQKKIADFLSSVDEIITASEKEVANLETQKKAVMKKIFSQEVRFKREDGSDFPEWEEKSLGSFAKRVTRKNKNNACKLPLTISAEYGLIDQSKFFNKTVASKDMSTYYLLQKGEFAFNKSTSKDYPVGAIKRLDRYVVGAVSPLYICFELYGDTVLSDFAVQYFETDCWNQGVLDIAQEGARTHGLLNISVPGFFATIHKIPSDLEEQRLIADFLSNFDEAIAAAKKELELWKELKKGLLQQMFV